MKRFLKHLPFIVIFFLFYLKIDSFAQHACNQACTGAANISCSVTTGSLSYNRGSCNTGLACYSGAGNRCRNPYCPNDTDCNCSNFSTTGYKVGMPDNQDIEPFRSQTVYFDLGLNGSRESSSQPYSFTNITRNRIHYLSVNNLPGSEIGYTLCYDNNTCHNTTPTPAPSNNRVYLCSNRVNSYISLYWHYTPLTANSFDIGGPTDVLIGDTAVYQANYTDAEGNLTDPLMYAYSNNCLGEPLNKTSSGSEPGIHTFEWQPTEPGNFVIYAAANSNEATCLGYSSCVDGPPRYLCTGPNTFINVTVRNPEPWYKLKDTSLNKIGDHTISVVENVKKFTDSDSDDNGLRYVIIGNNPGTLVSTGNYNPGPTYNSISSSNKNWYSAIYGNTNTSLFANFYQYLISRKLIIKINSLSEITKSGAYYLQSNNLDLISQPPSFNFILIVRNADNTDYGDVNIGVDNFNNTETSIFILAKNITVTNGVQNINGIFATTNNFIYNNTNGLKIKGNLLSKNAVILQNRPDNSRPSLFIVFSSKMYLDLLPYLSISKYEWKQTQ